MTPVREARTQKPLFEAALGPDWPDLPITLRSGHALSRGEVLQGRAEVSRYFNLPSLLIGAMIGLPKAGADIPVTVTKIVDGTGEVWVRDFGGRRFRSELQPGAGPGKVTERFGLLTFEISLRIKHQELHFPVTRGWFSGLPMPRWVLPKSQTRESERNGQFQFDVQLSAPLGLGRIIRYRGWLEPVSL